MPTLAPGESPHADVFFERGRTCAKVGVYEYAIEMFIQGLTIAPDALAAHQELRDIGIRRKAAGGKDMGLLDQWRMPKAVDAVQKMLNTEKRLTYDPGDFEKMVQFLKQAHLAGLDEVAEWMAQIVRAAQRAQRRW